MVTKNGAKVAKNGTSTLHIGEMPYFGTLILKKILTSIITLPILKKNPLIPELLILSIFENFLGIFT